MEPPVVGVEGVILVRQTAKPPSPFNLISIIDILPSGVSKHYGLVVEFGVVSHSENEFDLEPLAGFVFGKRRINPR